MGDMIDVCSRFRLSLRLVWILKRTDMKKLKYNISNMYKHFKNGYYVCDKGKVKRISNNRVQKVKIFINSSGYFYFVLPNSKNKEKVFVGYSFTNLMRLITSLIILCFIIVCVNIYMLVLNN